MEDSNNQAAPAPADNAVETTNSPDAAGVDNAANATTQKPAEASPAFNPQTSYEALVKQLESVNKNYGNLRSEFTRRTQYEAQLRNQIESLTKAFAEATKQEISPEDFMKSLQTQGIKAFDPLREEWTKGVKSEYDKVIDDIRSENRTLSTNLALMQRRMDTTNYPDFARLEGTMREIAESENCPVDWNQGTDVVLDTLYKLARDLKAEESVKQAHELGRKEADAQAAKEAQATVAAGGKTNTSGLDPRKLSASDLKKHFAQLGMVSD